MNGQYDDAPEMEKLDRLISLIMSNVSNARSILNNSDVGTLFDDAATACSEAKELAAKLLSGGKSDQNSDKVETSQYVKILKGKKILVLEDEIPIGEMLKNLLKKIECKVTLTVNKEQTEEKYKQAIDEQEKFDIVILDMITSGAFDGVECAEKLLALDPNAVLVMSSGYTESVAEEVKAQFKAILQKPYTYGELVKTLAKSIRPSF